MAEKVVFVEADDSLLGDLSRNGESVLFSVTQKEPVPITIPASRIVTVTSRYLIAQDYKRIIGVIA